MIQMRLHTILLALLCTAVAAQDRKPKHLLRLEFQKGRTTWHKVTTDLAASITVGETPDEQKIRLTVFLKTTVEDVTAEGARIAHEIYRLKTSGGEEGRDEEMYRYDSAHEDTPPPGASELAPMVGSKLVVELDGSGRVRKLTLPEAVADMDRESNMELFRMSEFLLPRGPELPETPVAVGAKWKGVPMEFEGSDDYVTESNYELVSVEDRKAHIRHDLSRKLRNGEDKDEKATGLQSSRTIVVDLTRGRAIREEENGTLRTSVREGIKVAMTLHRVVEETDGRQDGKDEERKEATPARATSRPSKGSGKR